jgi:hypothetical protein
MLNTVGRQDTPSSSGRCYLMNWFSGEEETQRPAPCSLNLPARRHQTCSMQALIRRGCRRSRITLPSDVDRALPRTMASGFMCSAWDVLPALCSSCTTTGRCTGARRALVAFMSKSSVSGSGLGSFGDGGGSCDSI